MAEVINLHPEAEKRGLTPAQWAEELYGYKGIECTNPGGEQSYIIKFHPEGLEYSLAFHEDGYPDGRFLGFNFYYDVELRNRPPLSEVNDFNVESSAKCVLDDTTLRFYLHVNLTDAQVTESVLKYQIDKWMLALPGIAAFAHRYGD